MAERLVSGDLQQEDQDVFLRPRRLEDFVGQANTKENLSISIQAAKIRQEPLVHIIIYGPPAWVRPHSPTSSPLRWTLPSG